MAFRFNWPEFDSEFYDEAKSQLEAALNKGNKPKNIVDHITVSELHMGTTPPELEILEVGELTTDKFRGIFKLTYAGDAYIVLQTKVQANPMHATRSELPRHTRPSVLAADRPLVVPMLLRISDLKLRGIVVLVLSKTKGVTLVFKNDPLEDIVISSTFDSVTSVRGFLQRAIENQLRNLFQEDLPVMIHNLSLRYLQTEQEKSKKKQMEEQLRMDQLRKWKRNGPGSVMSDPGVPSHSISNMMKRDTLSQPDDDYKSLPNFSPISSHITTPIDPSFGTTYPLSEYMSNDYNSMYSATGITQRLQLDEYGLQSLASGCGGFLQPFAASDLYLLGRYYNRRPGGTTVGGQSSPLYTEYASTNNDNHRGIDSGTGSAYGDALSREESTANVESTDRIASSTTSINSKNTSVLLDIYADDVDAPWYIAEGLGLSSDDLADSEQSITFPQDLVLHPADNGMTAKLAQLTCLHRTLSPLTPAVPNATHRSLPHTVTKRSPTLASRQRKIPKRRVIRLQGFGLSPSPSPSTSVQSPS